MSLQPFRLASGGCIDRARPLSFRFDGKGYGGFAGDTLASALLANGRHLFGRSFKYHRPRGCLTASSEEPNALVELRAGARREPNSRATMVELYDGLEARSQNRFPSLAFDLMSVNQCFAPFLAAGFYYKTFMWPSGFWEPVYEKAIRRAAGLGRAPILPDPDRYEHSHLHCDVLVVGGGAAGLSAALAAGQGGARVVLMEEMPWLGGSLSPDDSIDSMSAPDWIARVRENLAAMPEVTLKTRCAVFGLYDHNVCVALERVSDHLRQPPAHQPRQRLHIIRARRILLAAGAWERPLVFADNDRPGVMLASGMRRYMERFAVAPGRRVALATNNDGAYSTALAMMRAGVGISVVADARPEPSALSRQAMAKGLPVRHGVLPRRAHGGQRVRALSLQTPDGTFIERVSCDAVGVSGGYSPNIALASQKGKPPQWREDILGFVPTESGRGEPVSIGACRGAYDLSACLQEGYEAGAQAARECGFAAGALPSPPQAEKQEDGGMVALWHCPGKGKAFVDFQNDVTTADIQLAHREGYGAAEHLKRYTTLGMGTEQGRSANVNGLAILAEARGEEMAQVGSTRHRPPAVPVAIGAFVGHARGRDFQPVRRTALHEIHEKHGAIFVEAGHWLRPRYYPQAGEDMNAAIRREARQARESVGICDVSTLGKIDLFGKDVAEFLNRLYINGWSKLPVGKARYGVMLREDGMVFDDGTTARLGDEHFFMTTTTAKAAEVLAHMERYAQVEWLDMEAHFCSATEQWCAVSLAGPRSRDVLAAAFGEALDVSDAALPFMGAREFSWDGAQTRVFRISFSGERAYEVHVPRGYGAEMWERLLAAGAAHGIVPYGTEALGVLRIEKGHIAAPEMDGRTTAVDVGLGGMMSTRKHCIGQTLAQREALREEGRPILVGAKPIDRRQVLRGGAHFVKEIAGSGPIESLGWVSSVADSPALGCWIALGFLRNGRERLGERMFAWYPLREEMVEVEICRPVFFDPEGERCRG